MTFIGSKISLISNSQVRYEGTLYTLDPQGSTIALKNVKCMGTEKRRVEKAIKASNTIYEFMIFNGENIKNLEMIEEAPNEFNDPAILEYKKAPSSVQAQQFYQQQSGWDELNNPAGIPVGNGRIQSTNVGERGRPGGFNRQYGNRGGYGSSNSNRGRGGYELQKSGRGSGVLNSRRRGKMNTRRRGGNNSSKNATKKKDCPGTGKFLERQSKNSDDEDLKMKEMEFDFQGNLARFDMSTLREALPEDNKRDVDDENPEVTEDATEHNVSEKDDAKIEVVDDIETKEDPSAYKQENFFDTLSTDRETYKRPTLSEMRNLDAETFGKIGSTYRCKTRWFRRWRGNFRGRGAFQGSNSQRDGS